MNQTIKRLVLVTVLCTSPLLADDWSGVFEQVKDKVVQVIAFGTPVDWYEPYKQGDMQGWSGTGFFVNPNQLYTNYHVVRSAQAMFIQIPALGKERFEVEFVGGSPEHDCACLELKPAELERVKKLLGVQELGYLTLKDSDYLTPGRRILLVGYPKGQENIKINDGQISGHEPTYEFGECYTINAASNGGNSGGPVVNEQGEVIGILVGGVTDAQGYNHILPMSRLKVVLDELKDGEVVQSPFWGFVMKPATPATLEYLKAPGEGVQVTKVYSQSLGDKAGLAKGDIIYAINDFPVDRFGTVKVPWTTYKVEFNDMLARIKTGSQVTFSVYRDGQAVVCSVQISLDSPLKIKDVHPPFEEVPPFTVFGGLVIMELTQNYIEALQPMMAQVVKYGGYMDMLEFLKTSKHYSSKLCITHFFPETEVARNRALSLSDNFIKRVNGAEVITVQDFEKAVLDNAATDRCVIETEQGTVVVLPLTQMLARETVLAKNHQYSISDLSKKVAQVLNVSIE